MKLIRSCIVSFSMYSKIPMPQFKWNDDDMKYMLVFFPWIGAVIGLLFMLWRYIYSHFGVADICYVCIGVLIPIAVTGGFHIDGFMDTMDAFHSYKPREEKLAILKDSHIGAFAVIMLAAYGLLFMGAFSQIMDDKVFIVFCAGFFIARCLSGIAVVSFKSAKSDGLLFMFADTAHRTIVRAALYIQLALCMAVLFIVSLPYAVAMIIAAALSFWYYYVKTKKELGGITGDTAGYFVCICECAMAVALGGVSFII